ncbi:MAG: hypothetical protein AAGI11_02370 [Pseudomonadota bacterium]
MAASLALAISLAIIVLAGTSSAHLLGQQQAEYGTALAQQIARRISSALETGDLLSLSASLQRFVETSSADEVAIFDVEGKALGRAGRPRDKEWREYRAPVLIEQDIAGEVVITLGGDRERAAQLRFLLSLTGLAVLLSLFIYLATHQLGQRLGHRLRGLSRQIALDDAGNGPANELARLASHIEALPMDLLRTRSSGDPRDENYSTTAVLYLHLASLADYVDTLDHNSLHRYTHRLHQVIYAAAGFYGGQLQVSRQFGLVVFFSGSNKSGSAVFRAASCAWLIQSSCRELEKQLSLSLLVAGAIALSELGAGDDKDIYPGLYMQHTIDELQALCVRKPPRVLISPAAAEDIDIAGRADLAPSELQNFSMLTAFEGPYDDLLERQLRLICKRLEDPLSG